MSAESPFAPTPATAERLASFTDGVRRLATPDDVGRRWSGGRSGENFRCYLCGHRFQLGDGWRWQYTGAFSFEHNGRKRGVSNFLVCDACDGPDVIERWAALHREFSSPKFWALHSRESTP